MPISITQSLNNLSDRNDVQVLQNALGTSGASGDILALITNFNALLAKLDADVGVTDTNYASTLGITAKITK